MVHDYIVRVLRHLKEHGPMTWYHAVRLGWGPGDRHIGKAGVRRRILLRAIEQDWIAPHGDKLVITDRGRRELRDALRAV